METTMNLLVSTPIAITALSFASLLPCESIPWLWLEHLTMKVHHSENKLKSGYASPWLVAKRRLEGMRLLNTDTSGAMAFMHNMISSHLFNQVIERKDFVSLLLFKLRAEIGNPSLYKASRILELDFIHATLMKLLPYDQFQSLTSISSNIAFAIGNQKGLQFQKDLGDLIHRNLAKRVTSYGNNENAKLELAVSFLNNGNVEHRIGDALRAQDFYRQGHTIFEELIEAMPSNDAVREGFLESTLKMSSVFKSLGMLDKAERNIEDCLKFVKNLPKTDVSREVLSDATVNCMLFLGDMALAKGDFDKAETLYSVCLVSYLSSASLVLFDENLLNQKLLPLYQRLGDIEKNKGDFEKAASFYGKATELSLRPSQKSLKDLESRSDRSVCHLDLGDCLMAKADYKRARSEYESALEINEELSSIDPINSRYMQGKAQALLKLGLMFLFERSPQKSLEFQLRAKEILNNPPSKHEVMAWNKLVWENLIQIGHIEEMTDSADNAIHTYLESAQVAHKMYEQDSTNVDLVNKLAKSHLVLGDLLLKLGRFEAAGQCLTKTINLSDPLIKASTTSDNIAPRLILIQALLGTLKVHHHLSEIEKSRLDAKRIIKLIGELPPNSRISAMYAPLLQHCVNFLK
jgi:tetratricopeptide (TPR) repeat protein